MLPMMRNQTMKSWRSAEQWAMAAFIWLVLGPAPAAPACSTAVVLLIASLLAFLIMMLRAPKDGSTLWVRATFQFALPLHREDNT